MGTPSHPLCPPSSPSGHLAPASSPQFAPSRRCPAAALQHAARRNFPTLLSLFLLLVGILVLFVIGVQVVNPLAQLWGPRPNSETMKQLNSPPRRSPKIWFRFWTLIGFAPEKCSLVANQCHRHHTSLPTKNWIFENRKTWLFLHFHKDKK